MLARAGPRSLSLSRSRGARRDRNFAARCLAKQATPLDEVDFSRQQLVFGEDQAYDIRGETAGGQCADEDVGVEKDPHETSRKTSSSVK